MSVLAAAVLAGGAAAVLAGLPRVAAVRLGGLAQPGSDRGAPAAATCRGGGAGGGRPSASSRRDRTAVDRRRGPTSPARERAALALSVLLVAAVAVGPVVAGLAAGGTAVALRWWTRRRQQRSATAERDGAVEACGALAGELRAGRSPSDALDAAAGVATGPFRDSLHAAAATARLGGDVAGSLLAPVPGRPSAVAPVLRALAACWTVCAGTGTGLAVAVERLEEGLRAERAQRHALDAELAGPRATAGLLAVLPAAGLLMAAGLGADPVHVLLHTPLGLVCLAAGLGLDGLGVLWTQRLVAAAARAA